jgi:hypothetical protein
MATYLRSEDLHHVPVHGRLDLIWVLDFGSDGLDQMNPLGRVTLQKNPRVFTQSTRHPGNLFSVSRISCAEPPALHRK